MECRLSPSQLGALNIQSFGERMSSCAKLIVGEKKENINHELIGKIIVLQININFMIHYRDHGSITKVKTI